MDFNEIDGTPHAGFPIFWRKWFEFNEVPHLRGLRKSLWLKTERTDRRICDYLGFVNRAISDTNLLL